MEDISQSSSELLFGKGKAMVRSDSGNPEVPIFRDDVLKEMYVEYDTACDRLVSDPERLLSFAEDYGERTGQRMQPARVSHRLLALRKLGQAKGGLPRLRRKYNGRN
jgi:hypothetical protein